MMMMCLLITMPRIVPQEEEEEIFEDRPKNTGEDSSRDQSLRW